jgi:hypothetical protein
MAMICVMCEMNYLPEDITCVGVCKHCWPKYQEEHERRMVEIKKFEQGREEEMRRWAQEHEEERPREEE